MNYPKTLTAPVNQNDLYYGVRAMPQECPLALALKRAYPQFSYIAVFVYDAYVGEMVYKLSQSATKLVVDFDRRRNPKPRSVRLGNPRKRILG